MFNLYFKIAKLVSDMVADPLNQPVLRDTDLGNSLAAFFKRFIVVEEPNEYFYGTKHPLMRTHKR